MPIKYDKLFAVMKKKELTTYKIRKDNIISEGTLQNLRKNNHISTKTIDALCNALNCQPGDIMEYVESKN